MTKEEFGKLVKGLKSVYADPKFIADQYAFDMWHALLSDCEYKVVAEATKKYMMTNKFPPTPADIREATYKETATDEINPNQAWTMVYKAICNSNYNAKSEFEKLPPLVQQAVGSYEQLKSWASSPDFNEGVEQSHFVRVYNTVVKRAETSAIASPEFRNMLEEKGVLGIGALNE